MLKLHTRLLTHDFSDLLCAYLSPGSLSPTPLTLTRLSPALPHPLSHALPRELDAAQSQSAHVPERARAKRHTPVVNSTAFFFSPCNQKSSAIHYSRQEMGKVLKSIFLRRIYNTEILL